MSFRFTPEMYLNHFTEANKMSIEDIGITSTVILSWFPSTIKALVETTDAEVVNPSPFGNVFRGTWNDAPVTLALSAVGAPGTVMLMEELIACGAKNILGLGATGSLQSIAPIGHYIVATSALADEGTSRHYMPAADEFAASRVGVQALLDATESGQGAVHCGSVWSTDAIYRERVDSIENLQRQQVLGVDMETSAMYCIGSVKNIQVANILVVSDELWHEWRPAFHHDDFRTARKGLEQIVLDAASQLAKSHQG